MLADLAASPLHAEEPEPWTKPHAHVGHHLPPSLSRFQAEHNAVTSQQIADRDPEHPLLTALPEERANGYLLPRAQLPITSQATNEVSLTCGPWAVSGSNVHCSDDEAFVVTPVSDAVASALIGAGHGVTFLSQ
jgi:hypothetical protein